MGYTEKVEMGKYFDSINFNFIQLDSGVGIISVGGENASLIAFKISQTVIIVKNKFSGIVGLAVQSTMADHDYILL